MSSRAIFRAIAIVAAVIGVFACDIVVASEVTFVAQATPSWGTENRGSALPRAPDAVNRAAAGTNASATSANAAPRDRDCKSAVTRPEQSYAASFNKFYSDGSEDHGQILNVVVGSARSVQSDLEDLQVRVEQLRCEDQNIKAKLDYLIRQRTP